MSGYGLTWARLQRLPADSGPAPGRPRPGTAQLAGTRAPRGFRVLPDSESSRQGSRLARAAFCALPGRRPAARAGAGPARSRPDRPGRRRGIRAPPAGEHPYRAGPVLRSVHRRCPRRRRVRPRPALPGRLPGRRAGFRLRRLEVPAPGGGGANPQASTPGQHVPWLRGLLHATTCPRPIAGNAWLYGGVADARPRTNTDAHPVTNAHRLEEERYRPCTTGLIGISSWRAAGAAFCFVVSSPPGRCAGEYMATQCRQHVADQLRPDHICAGRPSRAVPPAVFRMMCQ